MTIIILLLIATKTWCLYIVSLDCRNLSTQTISPDENSLIKCWDSNTVILHSSLLNSTVPSITEAISPGWVEIKSGQTTLIPPTPEPITSCLSSIDGNGGVKSITSTDSLYLSAGITLKVPLISILFFQYGVTPGFGLRVRLSRVMEYGCTARPGETVQILQKFDEFNLTNWKFRPFNFSQGESIAAKGWIPLPATTVVEENEIVMCVTDTKKLQCRQ